MTRVLGCRVQSEAPASSLGGWSRAALLLWLLGGLLPVSASPRADLLARENLIPWELQWDQGGVDIGPEARARMLKERDFRRYALKYVPSDAAQFDAQIAAARQYGLDVAAVYFRADTEVPGEDPSVRAAFESIKRLGVRPQIWVSQSRAFLPKTAEEWKQKLTEVGFDGPAGYDHGKAMRSAYSSFDSYLTEEQKESFFEALHRVYADDVHLPKTQGEQVQRLEREALRIRSLAQLASRYGLDVGLYNHNGWFGLVDNQLAIIERLKREDINNVRIVYTFWHARDSLHDDVKDFERIWARIMPHVAAVAISGVRGEMESLYPSDGEDELQMLRVIQGSGWRGGVGVLCLDFGVHPDAVLRNMLRGVDWLAAELNQPGAGGVRPSLRD